ncbi:unnamed protein product, partial [Linum tenue]
IGRKLTPIHEPYTHGRLRRFIGKGTSATPTWSTSIKLRNMGTIMKREILGAPWFCGIEFRRWTREIQASKVWDANRIVEVLFFSIR